MANPKPKFYVKGNPTDIKQIGAQKNHLKFSLEEQSAKLATIGFGFGDHVNRMTSHDELEAVGHLQINEWKDRKSTRLNSSHVAISYAVFCLKKKTYSTVSTTTCTLARPIPKKSCVSPISRPHTIMPIRSPRANRYAP